jgi:UPF0755 protein
VNSKPPHGPAGRGAASKAGPMPVPPPASAKVPRSPRAALEPERVPSPKRRSKRVRHPLVIVGNAIFTVLIVVTVAVGGALYVGKQRFESPGPLAEDKVVNIPRGLGIKDISEVLQREGVIDQPWVFIGGVLVLKARGELKHGEYQFTKGASLADVVNTIIENKVVQHTLTIPEGLTSEQIVARLLENNALSGQIKEIPREGTLLPETYKPDERSRVASVFVNRLKNKMKLQSDPTIIYGLTGGKGSLGRPILKSEIEQPTPYNTYVIDGLPPGPIANPGRASLEAAANPARTKDLFFVADGSGGHVFSDNYAEHQKNVARLRVIEKNNAVSEPQPAKK